MRRFSVALVAFGLFTPSLVLAQQEQHVYMSCSDFGGQNNLYGDKWLPGEEVRSYGLRGDPITSEAQKNLKGDFPQCLREAMITSGMGNIHAGNFPGYSNCVDVHPPIPGGNTITRIQLQATDVGTLGVGLCGPKGKYSTFTVVGDKIVEDTDPQHAYKCEPFNSAADLAACGWRMLRIGKNANGEPEVVALFHNWSGGATRVGSVRVYFKPTPKAR